MTIENGIVTIGGVGEGAARERILEGGCTVELGTPGIAKVASGSFEESEIAGIVARVADIELAEGDTIGLRKGGVGAVIVDDKIAGDSGAEVGFGIGIAEEVKGYDFAIGVGASSG